jgi:hypothetical protein
MGFSIGNVLSDLKLPNLNLGHLATTALEDGKKALGDVVKDSFTLSNKPGQTFAATMNLSIGGDHLTLPNPVGELGNALFAGADKLLGKVGVNVDFKTPLEELFHLPIQGGSVDVPTLKARIQASPAAPAAVSGLGGGGGSATATTATTTANAASTTSTTGVGSGGGDPTVTGSTAPDATITGAIGTADTDLNGLIGSISSINMSSPQGAAQLAQVQAQISACQEMITTLSNILQDEYQMRMSIIGNIKGQ